MADIQSPTSPVVFAGRIDEPLNRWLWLVKWLLALPHVIVLVFLWVAFVVVSVVAGVSIVFTGRYPRGLFDFNLVAALFGEQSLLSRIVYGLVGLSALYQIVPLVSGDRQGR